MELRSLAYFTDLEILRFEGRVEDRDEYIVAESPGNPDYFWGNLLVMREIPSKGDLARWSALFQKEFAHQPLVKHMTFGWDSPVGEQGEVQEFLDAGFKLQHSVVLTTEADDLIEPQKMDREVEVRPVATNAEWEAALANQVACRGEDFPMELYLPFKRRQMAKYRRMTEAGLGQWYGAFLGDRLVADCGLFYFEKIGRYQSVGTHPDFRRRGICGALVFETARKALQGNHAHKLVMVADPEYYAAKIYESVGFSPTERQVGMSKYPEEWTT